KKVAPDNESKVAGVKSVNATHSSNTLNQESLWVMFFNPRKLQTGFDPWTIHCENYIVGFQIVLGVIGGICPRPVFRIRPINVPLMYVRSLHKRNVLWIIGKVLTFESKATEQVNVLPKLSSWPFTFLHIAAFNNLAILLAIRFSNLF
ncbi:MAG: hypothetical protein ACKOAU_00180, partial [Pirellula sp.]